MYAEPQRKSEPAALPRRAAVASAGGMKGPSFATLAPMQQTLNDSAAVQAQAELGMALNRRSAVVTQAKLSQTLSGRGAQRPIQRLREKHADGEGSDIDIHALPLDEALRYFDRIFSRDPSLIVEKGDREILAEHIHTLASESPEGPESKQEQEPEPRKPSDLKAPFMHKAPATSPGLSDLQIKVRDGFVSGLELLRWCHQDMQTYIDTTNANNVLTSEREVLGGGEWLLTVGKWAGPASRSGIEKAPMGETWLKTEPTVSMTGTKLRLAKQGNTERLYLGKDDPKYTDIVRRLDQLRANGMSDPEIAAALLVKMKGGGHFDYMATKTNEYLDLLSALLLGLEGSRANLTFATTLMTLEFIMAGHMTFKQAFAENEFGGEFPLASLQTGTGNLTRRREFITGKDTAPMEAMVSYPQKHQVPVKEMYTLINWTLQELGDVLPEYDKRGAEQLIRGSFGRFLETYYGDVVASKDASGKRIVRDFSLGANKRRIVDEPSEEPDEQQEEKRQKSLEFQEERLLMSKKEKARSRWREYLNQQAEKNPMANLIIMAITLHPESENEILDRLRVDAQGRILGYFRGG